MTVEVRPLNVRCNIQCHYCYQNGERDVGNSPSGYDLDRIKETVRELGQPFTLFGGEPLLVPIKHLQEFWRWGLEEFGRNGVQTNGTLITPEHIELFRKYNVSVGLSLDGPGDLNDARWSRTVEKTRALTAKVQQTLLDLLNSGVEVSLIVTLHRCNATAERLPRLETWFRELDAAGLKYVRLHLLEVDSADVRRRYALTTEENTNALLRFYHLDRELKRLRIDVFQEMRNLLLGRDDTATCIWHACDPYSTEAVMGVEGDGRQTNCGRTNKDGVGYLKSGLYGYERQLALYATPQEVGGCNGCRFFLMCKGQCPGATVDDDWRNRSEHCETWRTLFKHLEKELVEAGESPISLSASRETIEIELLRCWARGDRAGMTSVLQALGPVVSWKAESGAGPPQG